MERESWVTDKEINYRKFMVALNHQGGGVVFELMQDADLDRFMDDCYLAAVGGSS
jgi:hypothetical protein